MKIAYSKGQTTFDNNKPTIIFIHGSGCSKNIWSYQINSLAGYANTIAIDLPSHGESMIQNINSISEYAKVVFDFINEINPPNPIPCGFSMGGAITLELLINYRDLFKFGILVCTGAKLKVFPQIIDLVQKDYNSYIEMIRLTYNKNEGNWVDKLIDDIKNCRQDVVFNDFKACDAFDIRDKLNLINTPVLIITAENDILTPKKYGEFLEKNIENAKRAHIMDSGHFVSLEKPASLTNIIKIFLCSKNNELSCAEVFRLSEELGVSAIDIGKQLDFMKIKITNCSLGLFGYKPEKKIVKKGDYIDPEIKEAIASKIINSKISCQSAWEIAMRFKIPKLSVGNACETLGLRISNCQIGAF
ncbi:MAG: alpha/beta hydrolase [Desulfobacterales bacterium]|nr:alpha/beta hydrolase [Desulfobacterales bacterium]MBF0397364.1 alpha/beta hydrolase [Desulfobacterales bacterium]